MELQNFLTILRERWIPALATAVLVMAAAVALTLLQTPTYQATNRVFVQTQAGNTISDLTSGVNFASQQIITYSDMATSPLVLDPVIEELGLDMSAQQLASRISTSIPEETLILEITATAEDPNQAVAIANATSASLQQSVTALEQVGSTSTVELTVISPAVRPASAASPDIMQNLVLGAVVALAAGVAVAIARDLMDNRIRKAEDVVRASGEPVIATLPASRDAEHYPLVVSQKPHSAQTEAYRELRTNLQFVGMTAESRSILVTSSLPGEGKSAIATNLALVLSQSSARVLIIDADLRRPSLHDYLGIEGGAGLTSVLIGEAALEDVAQPIGSDGLEALSSGPIPPNPSELLGSERMRDLLEVAASRYDFVVVDTAPLLAVTDAAVLSRLVGGTIVVAQSERVKKPQLAESLEKLRVVEANVLGVLLNRVRPGGRATANYAYYGPDQTVNAKGKHAR